LFGESPLTVLGIETSCDETAVAILRGRPDFALSDGQNRQVPMKTEVLADLTLSQIDEHRPSGGVVPEIAARAHIAHLDGLVRRALTQAGIALGDLDAIAATAGPGLIGGVIVGLTTAKALAYGLGKPLIAINHLEGHALTARLSNQVDFPFLLLLVSGGHCQILSVNGVGEYQRLGTTIDDAVGEAFDKAAKLLGLGYPGGPEIEAHARAGDPKRFDLPRPMLGRPGLDFSFSGLKTALRQAVDGLDYLTARDVADLAASFQTCVGDCLSDRVGRALVQFAATHGLEPGARRLVVAGGVAANRYLRARLSAVAEAQGFELIAPPLKWCTDNAVMIAWAGIERLALGSTDPLDVQARARWPLDSSAKPVAHNKAQQKSDTAAL
jgi:N6-L-threonylcarbamoyladenine synthase